MYIHIDINSYFATLIQQEIPSLRGKPVGIVKEIGRTCIIAASKEAKTFGVKTGSLLYDALKLCPEITIVPTNFPMYLSATKQLKVLFESLAPDIDIFSLDEVFVYYTPLAKLHPSPVKFAHQIQAAIKATLGSWVTCSIGVAPNKFLAKMAGETAGPDRVKLITEDNKIEMLATTRFKDVCGIGYSLTKKLEALGVFNPYAINFLDDRTLERNFGSFWVKELKKMANGEETHLLGQNRDNPHMKGVSRSITCSKAPWSSEESIKQLLYNLTYEAMTKARKMKLAGRLIYLSFQGDGCYWQTHQTLGHHVYHSREFFELVYHGLLSRWTHRFPIIKCHVGMNLLTSWQTIQVPYFPEFEKQEGLEKAMSTINEKYGAFTLRSGLLSSREEIIWPEVTGFFGDKSYYLSES